MKNIFCVNKRTLLLIAGIVWLLAGFNVARYHHTKRPSKNFLKRKRQPVGCLKSGYINSNLFIFIFLV